MGVFSNGSTRNILLETATGATSYLAINHDTTFGTPANAAALDADYILIRNSNVSMDAYKNNASTNFAIVSTGLPSLNCFIGGLNDNGALNFAKAINVLWSGFGSKNISVPTFRTDLHATGL